MSTEPPHEDAGGLLPSRYRDPVRIATGGMGAVYRAHDERLGRTVAVKVQSPAFAADEVFRRRFRSEAVAAAHIDHPNVVTIYDVGEHGGLPYLVMEFLPGGSLQDRLKSSRPPREQALGWIAQAADALDAAHAAGIVHRDVKPANLLLDGAGRVKVADFGIARLLEDTGGTLTATGTVLGSAGYASPEQAQGVRATAASDVYSLAAVAFELLTGERPYVGRSGIAELTAHVREPVPTASARAADLSPRVDAVLARGLDKEPARRFASASAFAAALRAAVEAPTSATIYPQPLTFADSAPAGEGRPLAPSPGPEHGGRRRSRGLAVVAAAVVVTGAAAVGLIASGGDDDAGPTSGAGTMARPAPAAPPRTVVETVTMEAPAAPPRTVVQTVVPDVPVAPAPEPATGGAAPTTDEAVALTDRSTTALEEGDSATGLALAERALVTLAGSGDPYEGNARYNTGRALIDLGRCDEAVPHLERSVAVGGTDWQMDVRRTALREARDC